MQSDGKPDGDGAAVTNGFLGILNDLAQEPDPVLQAAAIFIGPVVATFLQEVHQQGGIVTCIDIDNVGVGFLGPKRRVAVPATEFPDIGFVHAPALGRNADDARLRRRAQWLESGIVVLAPDPVMGQFDTGQRIVSMDGVGHQGEAFHIVTVPQPRLR